MQKKVNIIIFGSILISLGLISFNIEKKTSEDIRIYSNSLIIGIDDYDEVQLKNAKSSALMIKAGFDNNNYYTSK